MFRWKWDTIVFIALPVVALIAALVSNQTEEYLPADEFYTFEDSGFSFRWSDEGRSRQLECFKYEVCAFADIRGRACPSEILVDLEFYDANGGVVSFGFDIAPAGGKTTFDSIEVGTNRDLTFDNFNIVGIDCYSGVPTGKSEM